ncbi:hypothetical protein Tco_1521150, partial [Tanacetum coccineum]
EKMSEANGNVDARDDILLKAVTKLVRFLFCCSCNDEDG